MCGMKMMAACKVKGRLTKIAKTNIRWMFKLKFLQISLRTFHTKISPSSASTSRYCISTCSNILHTLEEYQNFVSLLCRLRISAEWSQNFQAPPDLTSAGIGKRISFLHYLSLSLSQCILMRNFCLFRICLDFQLQTVFKLQRENEKLFLCEAIQCKYFTCLAEKKIIERLEIPT